MDDPLFVRRFERVGDLLCDRERFIDRDRAARNAAREVRPRRVPSRARNVGRPLEPVNGGDVRMVERGECSGPARESRDTIRIKGERLGQHLDRDALGRDSCRELDRLRPCHRAPRRRESHFVNWRADETRTRDLRRVTPSGSPSISLTLGPVPARFCKVCDSPMRVRSGYSQEGWEDNYGRDAWARLAAAKRKFDPHNVLTPGPGIFSA